MTTSASGPGRPGGTRNGLRWSVAGGHIPEAQSTRDGCEPALEVAKGQCIILSTSVGPHGDFYDVWRLAPANGYEPVSFGWRERPSRDEAWYAGTAEKHKSNPSYMAREYPSSAEEAFLYAEGR